MTNRGQMMPVAPVVGLSLIGLLAAAPAAADRGLEVGAQPGESEPRTALVIGNAKYASSPLRNPVHDAEAMADALRATGFSVVASYDLDQKAMKLAIKEFGRTLRSQGGVGLFYYAGHGMQVNGENYLIPVGAGIEVEEHVDIEAVRVDAVLAEMSSAQNRLNLVILDACRDNPFARSFRSSAKGLASIDAPSGTLVAYATAPGHTAADGAGKNGLYTGELIRNVRLPGLRIEDVFKRTRTAVRLASNGGQVPWESSSLEGDFFFVPGPAGAGPVLAPAPNQPLLTDPAVGEDYDEFLAEKRRRDAASAEEDRARRTRQERLDRTWKLVASLAEDKLTKRETREAALEKFLADFPEDNPYAEEARDYLTFFTHGRLVVETRPSGAVILINGEKEGEAPYEALLPPGEYTIVARLAGHIGASTRVTLVAEQETSPSLWLERIPANPYVKWGHVSFWTGLGGGGALIALGHIGATVTAASFRNDGDVGARDANHHLSNVAVSGWAIATIGIVTSIVLWILSPGDEAWEDSFQPTGPAGSPDEGR